jgi:tRNA pseudouridine55 synthase
VGGCAAAPGEVSGILNIDKASDWTSHDVVACVRRLTGQRRVGHAGTLDPFATGVLLVCLGQATRISEYLMEAYKLYRARVHFGTATDTYDVTGTVVAVTPVTPKSLGEVEALLARFTGRILQAPPPYSALKIDGQPAYRRARRGEAVAPVAREVEIYAIEVLSWEPPELEIEASCSKGTYIRSLAHDLGQAAGSVAHLAALQRRAVGHFTIADAISMPELEARIAAGRLRELLYPLDEALLRYPALIVSREDVARVAHGQPIAMEKAVEGGLGRVYGPDGEFVALVQGDAEAGLWRPRKVFAGANA